MYESGEQGKRTSEYNDTGIWDWEAQERECSDSDQGWMKNLPDGVTMSTDMNEWRRDLSGRRVCKYRGPKQSDFKQSRNLKDAHVTGVPWAEENDRILHDEFVLEE